MYNVIKHASLIRQSNICFFAVTVSKRTPGTLALQLILVGLSIFHDEFEIVLRILDYGHILHEVLAEDDDICHASFFNHTDSSIRVGLAGQGPQRRLASSSCALLHNLRRAKPPLSNSKLLCLSETVFLAKDQIGPKKDDGDVQLNISEVNAQDSAGRTPLYLSSNLEVVQVLHREQSDPTVAAGDGSTLMCKIKVLSVAKYVVEECWSDTLHPGGCMGYQILTATDRNGQTPLDLAQIKMRRGLNVGLADHDYAKYLLSF
jgi:hypothetical protein